MKEVTSVTKMMFAKSLMFGRRQDFCEKFKLDSHSIKEWNEMFKDLNLDKRAGTTYYYEKYQQLKKLMSYYL